MTNKQYIEQLESWKKVEKELEYTATYASPERRKELLEFLKVQFQVLLLEREATLFRLMEEKKQWYKPVGADNPLVLAINANNRGARTALSDCQSLLITKENI